MPNLHVLLAEDSDINAEIATALLHDLGCTVVRADDGEEAVQCFGADRFDLVLMDCQMPGMDGFEATGQIRQIEAVRAGRRTPIIALTANSLSGDRERCLAAGMDDHVAKPFRRAQLRTAMARWVGAGSGVGSGSGSGSLSGESAAPRASATRATLASPQPKRLGNIDRQALLMQLQIGGRVRPALAAKVIGLFLSDTPAILEALEQGLEHQDRRGVERAVHTLKSSAASVGAFALSELAGLAEGDARGGPLEAVQPQVAEIRRQFDHAVVQLQALRAELLEPQMEVAEP